MAINEIFDSLAADFHDDIADKGLRWRLVRSELMVRSDRRMLEAMIRNLLSNAVRYTDRGAVLLGCRRAGDKVRIEVWDSGVGITQDQLPHIFQEYYQGEHGAERGGFGLGLAIVAKIVDEHAGKISVESEAGRGSVFRVQIPMM